MDAIVNAALSNDDRFFADAAHIIELANGDEQEEATKLRFSRTI